MADYAFDPTLGYSVRETWEEAQKNPGAALDRCEIVLARQGMGRLSASGGKNSSFALSPMSWPPFRRSPAPKKRRQTNHDPAIRPLAHQGH